MNLKCKICEALITDTHVRVIKTLNGKIENSYLFCSDECINKWITRKEKE